MTEPLDVQKPASAADVLPVAEAMFFFGTLMDPDILEIVSGMPRDALTIETAEALDVAQREVVGQDFPVLVATPGARAEGILVRGLTALALDRILFFEGEEYTVEDLAVLNGAGERVPAKFFADAAVYEVTMSPWCLEAWWQEKKPEFVERTRRFMTLHGTMSAAAADAYW